MKRNILFLLSLCMLLLTCSDGNDPIKEIEKPKEENPFIKLKKTNIDFTNEGGSEAILIESNVIWTAKSSASWCTVTPSSGNKSTTSITLSAPANESYDNRSCTVTIESGNITKTITVNQGENLGLLVTQDRYELSNEESTIKVEVKANVQFEVEINDEWITKIETRGLTTSEMEFKIAKNDAYANRDGSITIKQKDGNITSTITIFQSQEDAIILSEKDFDLSSEAQSVEVEIKTNIDYELTIHEDAKYWVTHVTTRALRTETVVLDVAKNKDYTERTAKITIKDKKTNLKETVIIKQVANTGLIVSEDKYEVSNDGGIIEVEVMANVEFDIETSDKWITRVKTRGLTTTNLAFEIAKNKDYDNREGAITIKQKDGNLSSTIKVYQSQKDAIIISEKTFDLSSESKAIEVEVKTNVEFEVIIPKAAKSWVSYTPTRGLRTETLTLNISENKDYTARSTEVYVKNKKTSLQDTVTINQASNIGFTVSKEKFDLNNEATTIEVDVEANFDFDVKISDSWITQVETRGLTSTKLIFSIAKNSSYDSREGTITIKQKGGDLSSTIKVYQSQKDAIIISEKTFDLSSESQAIEIELKTNVEFEVIIPEAVKSWVSYTPTRGLRTETLLLNIAENEGGVPRYTDVFIKNKSTNLQETLTITQIGNEPGVYYVEKMGTLGSILSQTQKDTITTMIVKGEINKADFEIMKNHIPRLRYIDLKDVKCEDDKIPESAFGEDIYSNISITKITLPESITVIGDDAFLNCYGLTGNLIFPDGVTKIGESAFANCGFTGNLIIPDGVTTIGSSTFSGCSGFTGDLIIPDGVTTIGSFTFSGCSGFTGDLTIPDGVTTIGEGAFSGCSGFTGNLNLPDGLTKIESGTFGHCTGFTGNLIIPDGVTTIGSLTFSGCSGFTGNLILPDGLTKIESGAFSGCSGFTGNLILPDGLTKIGDWAFNDCTGFTGSLKLPEGLEELSGFNGCTGISGELIIPDGVHTIGPYAFYGCIELTGELNIPDGVTKIGESAFTNCIGLTGELILPKGLTTIGWGAFVGCSGFTGDLNLPKSLKTIGKKAFYGCKGLTGSLNLPDEMTIIGESAFEGSSNFSGPLILPENLKIIEKNAFSGCAGFTGSLIIPDKVTTISSGAFQNCYGFSKLVIGNSTATINESAFHYCRGLTEVILGNSLTTVSERAFYECSSITEKILFPSSLTSTRKESFYGCNKVEAFQFPHTTPLGYYKDMLPSNATVEVPQAAVSTYQSTNGWKEHTIVGY